MGSLSHVMARETMSRLEKLSFAAPTSAGSFPITNYKFKDLEQVAVLGSGTFGRVTLVKEKVCILSSHSLHIHTIQTNIILMFNQ